MFAETLAEQGRDREALPLYERALALRERTMGPDHPAVARTTTYLAATLLRLRQVRRAAALSQRALDIWEHATQAETTGLTDALIVRAQVQLNQHDAEGPALRISARSCCVSNCSGRRTRRLPKHKPLLRRHRR